MKNLLLARVSILKKQLNKYYFYLKTMLLIPTYKLPLCRIEEINIEKRIIFISCRGIGSTMKFKLHEIAQDILILSNLSPQHTSWIGYLYGKYYDSLDARYQSFDIVGKCIFSKKTINRYKVLAQDRKNNIIFLDTLTKEIFTNSPYSILSSKRCIMQFDSVVAFYIGILGGMIHSKQIKKSVFASAKPSLKVIQ